MVQADGVLHVVDLLKNMLPGILSSIAALLPKEIQNWSSVIFQSGEKQLPLIAEDYSVVDLIPEQAAQKPVLLPQKAVVVVQAPRLSKGGMNALHTGGDEHSVQAQTCSRRVRHHIT